MWLDKLIAPIHVWFGKIIIKVQKTGQIKFVFTLHLPLQVLHACSQLGEVSASINALQKEDIPILYIYTNEVDNKTCGTPNVIGIN